MPIISMQVMQQVFLVIFITYDFKSSFHFLRTIKDTLVSFFYQIQLQGSNLKNIFKFFNFILFFLLISVKNPNSSKTQSTDFTKGQYQWPSISFLIQSINILFLRIFLIQVYSFNSNLVQNMAQRFKGKQHSPIFQKL